MPFVPFAESHIAGTLLSNIDIPHVFDDRSARNCAKYGIKVHSFPALSVQAPSDCVHVKG